MSDISLEEASVVSLQQRRARAIRMRAIKTRLKSAKKRMSHRLASTDRLKQRASRKARMAMRSRMSGGKSYSDMSASQKIAVDRRLSRIPQAVLKRIAQRQLPMVRRAEIARLSSLQNHAAKHESFDMLKEHVKRHHQLFNKDKSVKIDRRFKLYREDGEKVQSGLDDAKVDKRFKMFKGKPYSKIDPVTKQVVEDHHIQNSYPQFERGSQVSFLFSSVYGDGGMVEGTLVGGDANKARIRTADGKLYRVDWESVRG